MAGGDFSDKEKTQMRKLLPMLSVAVLFAAAGLFVQAEEGKKVDIKGMAQCAKCALKEAKSCQDVVVVKEGDKEIKYYLVHDAVAKKAHGPHFCQAPKGAGPTVKVVGICEEKDGKLTVTASKIDAVD